MLYCTIQALGEMAVVFPVAGSFSAYSTRFLDPSWGFAMGWVRGRFPLYGKAMLTNLELRPAMVSGSPLGDHRCFHYDQLLGRAEEIQPCHFCLCVSCCYHQYQHVWCQRLW
jgi:hypothetical protein